MIIKSKTVKTILKKIINITLSPFLFIDFYKFKRGNDNRFKLKFFDFQPELFDKTFKAGYDRHYIYHTSWAARKLAETKPDIHVDISSSLYFVGIASAFLPIKFYDYRPADLKLNNLETDRQDLTGLTFPDNSIKSLSCLHTIEHIGLGRYGDKIDKNGDLKAITELKRVLAKNGDLFLVVPVGKPKIKFNAHRIYSLEMIKEYFKDLELKEFLLIPEKGGAPLKNAPAEIVAQENYGCGCFWFKK
jgi:hypothetical protein